MNTATSRVEIRSSSYRNPWYNPVSGSDPEIYVTDVKPLEYAGCLIFQRIKGRCWDVVKDGVCISQRAGLGGAKWVAEAVRDGRYDTETRQVRP